MEELKEVNGKPSDFNISSLKKVSDLIYFDGPLLSHFKNNDGDDFLFYWVDVDEKYNRWVIFKTEPYELRDYLDGNMILADIMKNTILYCVDIDNNLNYHNIKIIDIIEYEKLYMDLDYTLPFNNELDE